VPLKVIVASLIPSSLLKVRPVSDPSVSFPWVAVSVTRSRPVPSSTSRSNTLIALPLAVEKTSNSSSSVACGPGTVFTGGSLSALMLTVTVAESVSAPPEPLLPRSLTAMSTAAPPALKFDVGWNTIPCSAALMFASVPVKVIVPSSFPSPCVKLRPVVWLSVILPWLPSSVTRRSPVATSMSAMLIALPLLVEKTRSTSSTTVCTAGAVMTGASFTALTVMLTVSVSLSAPPMPVFPRSLVMI
jgi:hypothetical protein